MRNCVSDSPLLWFIDILWKFFEIWTCKSCWKENSLNSSSPGCCKEFLFFIYFFFSSLNNCQLVDKKERKKSYEIFIINKLLEFLLSLYVIFSSSINKLNWSRKNRQIFTNLLQIFMLEKFKSEITNWFPDCKNCNCNEQFLCETVRLSKHAHAEIHRKSINLSQTSRSLNQLPSIIHPVKL